MNPGLVLASATSPTEQEIFDSLVYRGIDRERLRPYIIGEQERIVHAWPVPEADHVNTESIQSGDFVLFYRGSNRYSWAAQVSEVVTDRELANDLAQYVTVEASEDVSPSQEFSDTVLLLDIPIPIELRSYTLHELLNINQDALTRTVVPSPESVSAIVDEYGSLEQLLQSVRSEPSVFIELTTRVDSPSRGPGGEFEIGTAAFYRGESPIEYDPYGTLGKADVGDLVVHVLRDTGELVGISTVSSPLDSNAEELPYVSRQSKGSGHGALLPLGNYVEFSTSVDIVTKLLDNEEYRERLEELQNPNRQAIYDEEFELVEDAYFTICPIDLLYLIIAEEPTVLTTARNWYWDVPMPDPTNSYDSVSGAVADIRIRLPFGDHDRDWFARKFIGSMIETFTDSLSSVEPNAELTQDEATHCELIAQLYTSHQAEFEATAKNLGIGSTNQVDEGRTLFFVLFRELQATIGVTTNMNQVKTKTILEKNYTVESPEIPLPDPEDTEPLDPKPKPANADDIARQLSQYGQMVFYGPPGTSKTYTAEQFARWWLHQQPDVEPHTGHLRTVTFHPSFTYEDFIEGLKADTTDTGQVTYDESPGVFLDIAETAREAYYATSEDEEAPRYVLIIDEINRGNLAQIFGEMMTALEYDKRLDGENETTVSLAHSGAPFKIPPNLYLIGTMNTADRSIALVDTALRRRFRFLGFPPDFESLYQADSVPFDSDSELDTAATTDGDRHQLLALSIRAVEQFNEQIIESPDLSKGKQIGHSYFYGVDGADDVVDLWRFELLPLLEEYYFGQFDRIKDELFNGDGDKLLDYDTEQIKLFDETALEETLSKLVSIDSDDESETSQ